MGRWGDEVSSAAVGILAVTFMLSFFVIGALLVGGIAFLSVQGYHMYKRRHDPPHLSPWAEPGDVSAFGSGGLHLGEEIRWD